MPAGLRRYRPPYPGVVVVHGGAASQEMYFWGAEGLAEAGYMVLTFQIPEPDNAQSKFHYPDTKAALNFFLSRPRSRTRAGEVNLRWAELDRRHVGLAGHSAGGVAVSQLGQEDRRVSAIVSWDRAQSSPMPKGLRIRTPALFLVADYLCQQVPVCVPQPFCKLQECQVPRSFTSPGGSSHPATWISWRASTSPAAGGSSRRSRRQRCRQRRASPRGRTRRSRTWRTCRSRTWRSSCSRTWRCGRRWPRELDC